MTHKDKVEWFSTLRINSYNAIFNFITGGRNIGKTWGLKKRTTKRAQKKGKKAIWVRRTKSEAAECAATFFESKDLQKFCGVSLYDKTTNPDGNIKIVGRRIYIRRRGGWTWFIRIIALCEYKTMRSADDVDCDTIIFDEFTTTPEKYALYRGNEAKDFIDLFISIMRQHEVKCFFSGNKESVSNPFFNYFKLPPIPLKYEGIRTFKKGTICLQQLNDIEKPKSTYQKKVDILLGGTDYGDYLTKGTYKNQPQILLRHPPARCEGYIQLYWNNQHIKIMRDPAATVDDPEIYITNRNDTQSTIFSDTNQRIFPKQKQLQRRAHRNMFRLLEQAVSDNRVAYNSYNDYENVIRFYKWLGITN